MSRWDDASPWPVGQLLRPTSHRTDIGVACIALCRQTCDADGVPDCGGRTRIQLKASNLEQRIACLRVPLLERTFGKAKAQAASIGAALRP